MSSVRRISKVSHRGGPNSPEGRAAIGHNPQHALEMKKVNNEPKLNSES
jgi:hypothetical protein